MLAKTTARKMRKVLSAALLMSGLFAVEPVLAQATYTTNVAVVFTSNAVTEMGTWENEVRSDPNVFVTQGIADVNAALASNENDLGELAQFQVVDVEVGTLQEPIGNVPFDESQMPYPEMLNHLDGEGQASYQINGQTINHYLAAHSADVLVIAAHNGREGALELKGIAEINVIIDGVATTKQIVIVDVGAAGLSASALRATLLLHELLHLAGIFDNTGDTDVDTPATCTVEMQTGFCGINATRTTEIDDRNRDVEELDCAWLDANNHPAEIPDTIANDVCNYLISQGWDGNRDWLIEKGFPLIISSIADRKFSGGGGGGGGGGPPPPPERPQLNAVPYNCAQELPGYPPLCEYDIYWYYDNTTDDLLFYNYYAYFGSRPAWLQPAYYPYSWTPAHITAQACGSNGCSEHSDPLYIGPYW